jgi:hypothetical protein
LETDFLVLIPFGRRIKLDLFDRTKERRAYE